MKRYICVRPVGAPEHTGPDHFFAKGSIVWAGKFSQGETSIAWLLKCGAIRPATPEEIATAGHPPEAPAPVPAKPKP